MATKKLFWLNPYQTELQTTIISIHGNDITVAETIFYAFSGAQESDEGTIGNKRVVRAQKEDKEILYTLEDVHELRIGRTVTICIDWVRRYKLMRLHFAAEIILELVKEHYPELKRLAPTYLLKKHALTFDGQNLFQVSFLK